jgi:hypothetical protein
MFPLDVCSGYGTQDRRVEEFMLLPTREETVDVRELKSVRKPSLPYRSKIAQP